MGKKRKITEAQKSEAIRDIQQHIQFAVTVVIFFSGLWYTAAGGPNGDQVSIAHGTLLWGLGVAFYAATYLYIRIFNKAIGESWIGWIRGLISLDIGACAITISVIVAYWDKPVSSFYYWAFMISFIATFVLPIITFFVALAMGFWLDALGIRERIWRSH